MEQFLACHQHAFEFFGNRVPVRIPGERDR